MKKNIKEIQSRASLVKKMLLVQPSSASAERVFSLLSTLSFQRESALKDYIEASAIIRYNSCQRKHKDETSVIAWSSRHCY